MPHLSLGAEIDPVTADLAVLSRDRVVMRQLLLRCVQDPLNPEPLQAAYNLQQMLTEDLAAARARLQAALS